LTGGGPEPERAVDVEPAPAACAAGPILLRSSHAPVFTLPACAHTIVGPPEPEARAASSASGSIAPFASAGISSIVLSPRPSKRIARSMVAWRSSPARILIGGAP
jgi:hypothetical protein